MCRIMKKLAGILIALLLPLFAWGQDLDMDEYLFGHVGDSYGWHITTIKGEPVSIHLPIIVRSKTTGWHVFSSARLEHGAVYEGFMIPSEGEYAGKVVEVIGGEQRRRKEEVCI